MSPSSGGGFELPRHSSGDGWRFVLRRGHYSAAALTPRLTARGGSRASRAGPPPRLLPSGGAPAPSLVPPLPTVAPLLTSGLRGERLRATPAHFFSATPMSFHAGCAGCRQHCVVGIVGGPFWPWLCSCVASPPPKRYAGANARTTGQGRYVPLHRRARTPLSLHFTPPASCARIFYAPAPPTMPTPLASGYARRTRVSRHCYARLFTSWPGAFQIATSSVRLPSFGRTI